MIFEELGLNNNLLSSIKRLGITEPTQIQELSVPHIIAGEDVIGESATGSGKTLAFGCGIIEKVKPGNGLQALILTPTRELAEQVKNAIRKLSNNIKVVAVYGGVSINPQIDGLAKADVAVATPGRLLDHLQRSTINTSKINLLVLDEADRMLDMGFINDVEQIIGVCPPNRQTLFFSATISPYIRDLANRHMKNPKEVFAKKMVDPSKLMQVYYDIKKNVKLSLLIHLLQNEKAGLVMVFCNTRRTTDFVAKNLNANNIRAIAIHGGFSQSKRLNTIDKFHKAGVGVLVCTDVAARGLHIDCVSHVYNYEIPRDPNDYVHRIGRTARAGEEGKVINLLCDYDYDGFARVLQEHNFNIKCLKKPMLQKIRVMNPHKPQRRGTFHKRRRR